MRKWGIAALVAISLVLLISVVGEYLVLAKHGRFTGGDTALHLRLTEELLRLKYPGSSLYPYPPGFHLLLAFLSISFLASPFEVMRILQLFVLVLAVVSTAYLVYRKTDLYTTAILAMLLTSSPAFWDRSSQVIPQALDFALLPLAYYAFMDGRTRTFIAISTFLVYNHFAYAILPIGGLFLYSAFNKRRFKEFIIIGVLSLPIIVYMTLNISNVLLESVSVQNLQEEAVLREPMFAIKYLGYPLFFLVYVVGLRQMLGGTTPIEVASRYWAISLMPFVVYFPDRFIEYVSQPLAIMGAISIAWFIKGDKARAGLLLTLLLFTAASLFAFYSALLTTGDVLLPLDTLSPFAS